MIDTIPEDSAHLIKFNIKTSKDKFDEILTGYRFYDMMDESFDINSEQIIIDKIKKSKAVIIEKYLENEQNTIFLIFSFYQTIIIIEKSLIKTLDNFFSKIDLPIFFLSNVEEFLIQQIENHKNLIETNQFLNYEIFSYKRNINILKKESDPRINKMIPTILSCISGYLIRESYSKSNEFQFESFNLIQNKNNYIKTEEKQSADLFNEYDFIELRNIGNGTVSSVFLNYQLENRKLVVIKKFNDISYEDTKLINRENNNYLQIDYPLLPKYFGKIKTKDFPIIQFINGQTLLNIEKLYLTFQDKLAIIFQLMMIIEFLHDKGFVYRDLKPDNIMIDGNKTIFIIDFDRMIKLKDIKEPEKRTCDFTEFFSAPEISQKIFSDKNDIYSIGQMICYIINEKKLSLQDKPFENNAELLMIYKQSTNIDYEKRPSISELMFEFYLLFSSYLNESFIKNVFKIQYFNGILNYGSEFFEEDIEKSIRFITFCANQKISQAQLEIGLIYYDGYYIEQDINKAIFYITLAADQNNAIAQNYLGIIYSNGQFVKKNEEKSIHYLLLSADQKYPVALYNLGLFYFEGVIVPKDIKKSIHYYSLAAELNDSNSQYEMGLFYYKGEYIKQDIKKAIEYFTLSANQNNPDAQSYLGYIYCEGIYVKQDISKGINYLTLAADQNIADAQNNLGFIYLNGKYIPRDINKSIHYLTLAANQDHSIAQFNLGFIYYDAKYIPQNINKSIHYFTLSANKGFINSQVILGLIYFEGRFVMQDIKKSIYYFTLSANQNDMISQNNLGLIYSCGGFITPDINKAIYYFTLAANQNHPNAQNSLGLIFSDGKYIKPDINKAIYYFTLAANQNHLDAQANLATIYCIGKYIKPDINKAIYYFTLAANQNHLNSQTNLGIIYYESNLIKRDINKSIYYFNLAANQNDSNAQFYLGMIYIEGKYIPRNITKGIRYLSMAANQNDPKAQNYLGIVYSEGIYITRDINRAIHYFSLAAKQNYLDSLNHLGLIYSDGLLISPDIPKAINYFTLAINGNNPKAQYNLGCLYYEGKFIKRDIEKAIYYFSLSANQNSYRAYQILGLIYCDGKYIKPDINKAIYCISQASNLNDPQSQFIFSILFFDGKHIVKNIKKALYYLNLSAKNQFIPAQLAQGDLYLIGKYVERDIKMTVKLYKEVSCFNNQYAKNNLGVIYKNGLFGVEKNLDLAKEYFYEAIQQNCDFLSIYNLSNILLDEEKRDGNNNKSINSLIKSSHNIYPYRILLGLIFYKKYGSINIEIIENEIKSHELENKELATTIYSDFLSFKKECAVIYSHFIKSSYQIYRENDDYIYINYFIFHRYLISVHEIDKKKTQIIINQMGKNINNDFYEGFGIELNLLNLS